MRPVHFRSALLFALVLLGAGACAGNDDPARDADPSAVDAGSAGGDAGLPADDTDPSTARRLDLNDVSVLFPLPATTEELGLLLGADDSGPLGELLPADRLALAVPLVPNTEPDELRARLRVVAARVDPCFPGLGAPCERQLRLVLQPVIDSDGPVAQDAALHLFYEQTAASFEDLLDDLEAARALAPGAAFSAPLGVHPALARQGLSGPYAEALRAAILEHAGASNLRRMTFMQVAGLNNARWIFGGFDFDGDRATPMVIADTGSTTQRIDNIFVFDEADFVATIEPPVKSASADLGLLMNSGQARQATPEALEAALGAVLRIENPSHHTPESVNCVACHVADQARRWVERNTALRAADHPDRYTSAHDLTSTSEVTGRTAVLRAFGWFARERVISQRTINESAEVLSRVLAPGSGN